MSTAAPDLLVATTTSAAEATAIGWQGVAFAGLLVVVAVLVSVQQRLGLQRSLLEASLRALGQLLVVGFGLRLLFAPDVSILWSVGWVAFMVLFAAWTVTRRAPSVPGLLPRAALALGAAALVTLGTVFGLGIFPFEPRYLVPTAGMMVGNTLQAGVLVVRRVVDELTEQRAEVEARVALGQPWQQASRRLLRRSLRDALTPQVETTRAVGLVFLPGAMTGLILGGVDPVDAVLVQAAIMFLILGGTAIVSVALQASITGQLFSDDDRLVPLAR